MIVVAFNSNDDSGCGDCGNKKAPWMISRPPGIWSVWMIIVRVIAIIPAPAINAWRPLVRTVHIAPHYGVSILITVCRFIAVMVNVRPLTGIVVNCRSMLPGTVTSRPLPGIMIRCRPMLPSTVTTWPLSCIMIRCRPMLPGTVTTWPLSCIMIRCRSLLPATIAAGPSA
jgi:hypothetical protein